MTAPRQEPSTKRDIVGLGWGERQLARRPALSAGCPCPLEFAFTQGLTTASAADDTLTTLSFAEYGISPGATAISIDVANRPFKLLVDGFYQFWLDVEWTASGFTDVRHYGIYASGAGYFNNNDATYVPRTTVSDPYLSGATFSAGPLHVTANSGCQIAAKVHQKSGVSKDLNTAFFTVAYLGPGFGIDDGVTAWTDLVTGF